MGNDNCCCQSEPTHLINYILILVGNQVSFGVCPAQSHLTGRKTRVALGPHGALTLSIQGGGGVETAFVYDTINLSNTACDTIDPINLSNTAILPCLTCAPGTTGIILLFKILTARDTTRCKKRYTLL